MTEENKDIKLAETPIGIPWYHPAFLIATWFGIGKIPFAPGTMGSLFTFPLFIASHCIFAFVSSEETFTNMYLLFITLLFIVGQWATSVYMKRTGRQDPKEVVIDEVVGQMLVFLAGFLLVTSALNIFELLYGTEENPLPSPALWQVKEFFLDSPIFIPYTVILSIISVICFILFRIFDIWKPWPISWCDKNIKNSFGVMFDDVFAAAYAAIALYGLAMLIYILKTN